MKLASFGLRLVVPLSLAWSPALAQGKVWVVDDSGGPGVDFTDLPPAIAAASPGDVLLLRSGSYSKPVVSKGLTLQADQGATVTVPSLRVELVPAGERVAVLGLRGAHAMVSGCAGKVWIEGCRFETLSSGAAGGAVSVFDCADVVLVGVEGIGNYWSTAGLRTSGSSVHVYECNFEGSGGGWCDLCVPGSPIPKLAVAGAVHESGELVAHATTFEGGHGFPPWDPTLGVCLSPEGATGAAAVTLLAPAYMRDCQLHGGLGGVSFLSPCAPGFVGPPFSDLPPVELQGEYVALDVPAPIRENGAFDLTLSGSPGVLAVVGIAAQQDALLVPAWGGGLVIQGPYLVLPPVVLPPSGTLALSIELLDLGPSIESLTFLGQVAAVDAFGAFTVNGAASVLLLDGQF